MKELIKTYLADIIRKMATDFTADILVEIPENKKHGDYTANVAFALAKVLGKSPQEIAKDLADELEKQKISDFSKIESKDGFINFFLSSKYLLGQLGKVLKLKNKYGFFNEGKGKQIQVEFISANPTGPLTVGNGRGGSYGDTLANVLETRGHEVVREFFINDRGGQISALGRSIKLAQGEKLDLEKIELENLYRGDYINDLARQISGGLSVEEAGQKAVELILETYIKPAVKRLGIKFDNWFSEKSLYKDKGKYEKVMENLMRKNLVYEKDGATWMKTSELGDDKDRVLIKSSGDETYFMSDILYHFDKFNVRKFDKVINIWGADHHGDVPRLLAALKIMGIDSERLDIMLYQFVRLIKNGKEFKVSKRAGTFVTLEELINEVGLDAARFFFLMYSPNTHMDFDMGLAKQRSQKNPVYYLQYAHARIASILRKAQISKSKFQTKSKAQISNIELLREKEELNLIRKLTEFPELLSEISMNYEVHRLPRYSMELAREFHNFYEKYRVITEDENLTSARLVLVTATKIVLANSLDLMGIKAPDKM